MLGTLEVQVTGLLGIARGCSSCRDLEPRQGIPISTDWDY